MSAVVPSSESGESLMQPKKCLDPMVASGVECGGFTRYGGCLWPSPHVPKDGSDPSEDTIRPAVSPGCPPLGEAAPVRTPGGDVGGNPGAAETTSRAFQSRLEKANIVLCGKGVRVDDLWLPLSNIDDVSSERVIAVSDLENQVLKSCRVGASELREVDCEEKPTILDKTTTMPTLDQMSAYLRQSLDERLDMIAEESAEFAKKRQAMEAAKIKEERRRRKGARGREVESANSDVNAASGREEGSENPAVVAAIAKSTEHLPVSDDRNVPRREWVHHKWDPPLRPVSEEIRSFQELFDRPVAEVDMDEVFNRNMVEVDGGGIAPDGSLVGDDGRRLRHVATGAGSDYRRFQLAEQSVVSEQEVPNFSPRGPGCEKSLRAFSAPVSVPVIIWGDGSNSKSRRRERDKKKARKSAVALATRVSGRGAVSALPPPVANSEETLVIHGVGFISGNAATSDDCGAALVDDSGDGVFSAGAETSAFVPSTGFAIGASGDFDIFDWELAFALLVCLIWGAVAGLVGSIVCRGDHAVLTGAWESVVNCGQISVREGLPYLASLCYLHISSLLAGGVGSLLLVWWMKWLVILPSLLAFLRALATLNFDNMWRVTGLSRGFEPRWCFLVACSGFCHDSFYVLHTMQPEVPHPMGRVAAGARRVFREPRRHRVGSLWCRLPRTAVPEGAVRPGRDSRLPSPLASSWRAWREMDKGAEARAFQLCKRISQRFLASRSRRDRGFRKWVHFQQRSLSRDAPSHRAARGRVVHLGRLAPRPPEAFSEVDSPSAVLTCPAVLDFSSNIHACPARIDVPPSEFKFSTVVPDSGAGRTILSGADWAKWSPPPWSRIPVRIADKSVSYSVGGCPLYANVVDESGVTRRVLVADAAWGNDSFGETLISEGQAHQRKTWKMDKDKQIITFKCGTVMPINFCEEGCTWSASMEIEPWHVTASILGDVQFPLDPLAQIMEDDSVSAHLAPVVRPSGAVLNPFAKCGRPRTVHWPGPKEDMVGAVDLSKGPVCEECAVPAPACLDDDGDSRTAVKGGVSPGVGVASSTLEDSACGSTMSNESSDETVTATVGAAGGNSTGVPFSALEHAWVYFHNTYNHSDEKVQKLVDAGILRAKKPLGFRCKACALAKQHRQSFHKSRENKRMLRPFEKVETDLYGPILCDDPRGLQYMVAYLEKRSGHVFAQAVQRKSDSVKVLGAYDKWFRKVKARVEEAYGCQIFLGEESSDRGGEYTGSNTTRETEYDALSRTVFNSRRFGSAGTSQTAAPSMERFWNTMTEAGNCMMLSAPAVPNEFKLWSLQYAVDVYNRVPTEACKGDSSGTAGVPPLAALGLDCSYQDIVPFGNPCEVLFTNSAKHVVESRSGFVIGFAVDTPGYIVLLKDASGNVSAKSDIVATVHVNPSRANREWTVDEKGVPVPPPPLELRTDYAPLPRVSECTHSSSDEEGPRPHIAPYSVGTTPGAAGSRLNLYRGDEVRSQSSSSDLLSIDEAAAIIREAQEAGRSFRFQQDNPKAQSSHSRRRYDEYKHLTSFAELHALKGRRLPDGRVVMKTGPRHGDFINDVRHGYVRFILEPDPPAVVDVGVTPLDKSPVDLGISNDVLDDGRAVEDGQPTATGGTTWSSRLRPRRQMHVKAALVNTGHVLSPDEVLCLEAMARWQGPESMASPRPDSFRGEYPSFMVHAAVAETLTGDSDFNYEESLSVASAPEARRGQGMVFLPSSLSRLRALPEWLSGILPGIRKELKGLKDKGVWEEVECPIGVTPIPTFQIHCRKADGRDKTRLVAIGNRSLGDGVHYTATATSMATQTAIKMITAFAAGCGLKLYSVDFEQAFLNADIGQDDIHVLLPDIPHELVQEGLGPPKGKRGPNGRLIVGKLKKALYGLRDAPRLWQQHLVSRLCSSEIGAEFLSTDRNVFKFVWKGEMLIGAIHVDDILFAPGSDAIRLEFLRRIRAEFCITGGDSPTETFCGFQFKYLENGAITLHQEKFESLMLEKYGALNYRPRDTPFVVGKPPLKAWKGSAPEKARIDFMSFVGDLHWAARSNPRLAFPATSLGSFVKNPSPEHFKAAKRVLEHMSSCVGQGITYHHDSTVLNEVYPHRNKLIAASDADFSHKGEKSVSGAVIMMNGGAIFHSSRRQSSVSMTSTEAEVKAAGLLVANLEYVIQLWSEIAGIKHGMVRCVMDNQTAVRQVTSGTDSPAAAPYLRTCRMIEEKVYSNMIWWDFVHGEKNIADILTKQVRATPEFQLKDGAISGIRPKIFGSERVKKFTMKFK